MRLCCVTTGARRRSFDSHHMNISDAGNAPTLERRRRRCCRHRRRLLFIPIATDSAFRLCPHWLLPASQVKLAVSLHAANDRERSALLPVNRRFPLSELMDACLLYTSPSPRDRG